MLKWRFGLIGGAKFWIPYWNVASFMGQFLCGSLAAFGIAVIQNSKPKGHYGFDLLAVIALIAMVLVALTFDRPGQPSLVLGQPYAAPLFSLCCALILLSLNFSRVAYQLVDNRFFRHVAKLSFGIYLWHFFIMELIRTLVLQDYAYNGMMDWMLWFELSVIAVLLTWVVASFSYYFWEAPILTWVRLQTGTLKQTSIIKEDSKSNGIQGQARSEKRLQPS